MKNLSEHARILSELAATYVALTNPRPGTTDQTYNYHEAQRLINAVAAKAVAELTEVAA